MRTIQIDRYGGALTLREGPIPSLQPGDVLLRVRAAALNPLDMLIQRGDVRLIQDYAMPLTLGNECSGEVEEVEPSVKGFRRGDRVYCRLPWDRLGALADYVAVPAWACAPMPRGIDFVEAATLPLAGLTAIQGITEELEMRPGERLLITGGSGSLGEVAVPVAKALGLEVVVSGNSRAKTRLLKAGADQYIDYTKQNYWEEIEPVDGVMDTLGTKDFAHALSVVKPGGGVLSLRGLPNRTFARRYPFSPLKRWLFGLAGLRYDWQARRAGKYYRFMFVRADGQQLEWLTRLVEERSIRPPVSRPCYPLPAAAEAFDRLARGHLEGKVVVEVS